MKTFRQFLEQNISSVEQRRLDMNRNTIEGLANSAEERNKKSKERAAQLKAEQDEREAQRRADQEEREKEQLRQRLQRLEKR